ncbi:MAG: DUF3783 domain-containing protein [Lachnospiraceae bacterium]|nr:DUF3783 domain-containing protein [Lachnospiraceae bacterium]
MARVLVFGVQAEELAKIRAAAGGCKLRVHAVPEFLYRQKIGVLAQADIGSLAENVQMGGEDGLYSGEPLGESLLLACGVTEKQLDKLLAALKRAVVQVDYKAVLTEANAGWNVLRLFAELGLEKAAYKKG